MPIYEYFCEKCHATQDFIQKFDEPAPSECPLCHEKNSLKKAVTKSAFHLKGGGWYKDLYSSTNKAAPAGSDTKTSTTTSEETKKESKVDSEKKDK